MELDRLLINNKDNESFKARPGQIEFIMFGRVVVGLFSNKGNYERGRVLWFIGWGCIGLIGLAMKKGFITTA